MTDFLHDLVIGWWSYGFMRTALAAVLLFAPMYGILGTMVVDGRMAFFSDSLGHSALTGIALGLLLGLRAPLPAMVIFGVVFAALLCYVKARSSASTDTTIGVFSATAMALGVVLLSLNGGFARYSNYLIGDLLAIVPSDLVALAVALALTLLYWAFYYNRLLLVSVQRGLAQSRGVRAGWVELSFACLVAVVVMLSIRWVGTLMINAMLVLPAATARNLAPNTRVYLLLSVLLALVCGVLGLMLSYALGTASGATIVLLLSVCYGATLALRSRRHA